MLARLQGRFKLIEGKKFVEGNNSNMRKIILGLLVFGLATTSMIPARAIDNTFTTSDGLEFYSLKVLLQKKIGLDKVCINNSPAALEKCGAYMAKDPKPIVLNRSILAYVASEDLTGIVKTLLSNTKTLAVNNSGNNKGKVTPENLKLAGLMILKKPALDSKYDSRSKILKLVYSLTAEGAPTIAQTVQIGFKKDKLTVYGKDIFGRDYASLVK